jgi:hypothetical protein
MVAADIVDETSQTVVGRPAFVIAFNDAGFSCGRALLSCRRVRRIDRLAGEAAPWADCARPPRVLKERAFGRGRRAWSPVVTRSP